MLTALFNAVLRTEHFPSSWKESTTILLHKKGDVNQLNNWRPISLGDSCPKLFAALLADRVKAWSVGNERFSKSQKGFLQFEGCFEHNFVLQEVIRNARARKAELVIGWLDLSNAFNSVPHSSILRAFELHGLPPKAINVIRNMYSGVTTRVRTRDGLTAPIAIQSGVRQGCPLSPDVFNLTLEVVLREIQRTGEGYVLGGRRHTTLAYADDLAVISDSPDGMMRLLAAAERGARAVGLSFNAAKCATLHLGGPEDENAPRPVFSLQGTPVPALAPGEAYSHLGIPTGYQVRQTPITTLRELVADIGKLDHSLLAPWQKLDAVGTFLLPRLDFILQGAPNIEREYLTEADRIIRRSAKSWMNLPQRASAELVYIPPSQGGAGLLPLADQHSILTVAHGYRMLHASDAAVSELAQHLLRETVAKRLKRPPTNSELAAYLSGELDLPRSGAQATFWARVRTASLRLTTTLGLRWHSVGGEVPTVRVGVNARGDVPPRDIIRQLRSHMAQFYATRLSAKPDQGRGFEVVRRERVSNHFLRTGKFIRFCDWRFVHRARLGILPLNATRRWETGADKRCRRCGYSLETTAHVLSHCEPLHVARRRRHNNVQDRLVKAAANCPGTIFVDRTVEGTHGEAASLRPDIVIRDEANKTIKIIDVAIPFENR